MPHRTRRPFAFPASFVLLLTVCAALLPASPGLAGSRAGHERDVSAASRSGASEALGVEALLELADDQRNQGQLHASAMTLERAWDGLDTAEASLETRARVAAELARTYHRIGRNVDAARLFRAQLDAMERLYGYESERLVGVLIDIVESERRIDGVDDAAATLLRRALLLQSETNGHSVRALRLLSVHHNLAQEFDQAAARIDEAIAAYRPTARDTGRFVVELLNQSGMLWLRSGRLDTAEARFREALSIEEAANGQHHVRLVRPLDGLGRTLAAQGRLDDARSSFDRAIAVATELWGADHENTIRQQAAALQALGDESAARELRGRLYHDGRRQPLSAETRKELTRLQRSAADHRRRGAFVEAEAALLAMQQIHLDTVGPESRERVDDLWRLGELFWSRKLDEEAERLFVESLELQRRLGLDHGRPYEHHLGRLGSLYLRMGETDRAESLQLELLERRRSGGAPAPELAESLSVLANIAGIAERPLDRADYLNRRIAVLERVYIHDARELRDTRLELGRTYNQAERPEDAATILDGLARLEARDGNDARLVTVLREQIATHRLAGRIADAEALLYEALGIDERRLADSPKALGRALSTYARELSALGRPDAAAALHERALALGAGSCGG